jgi:hypothetical protein
VAERGGVVDLTVGEQASGQIGAHRADDTAIANLDRREVAGVDVEAEAAARAPVGRACRRSRAARQSFSLARRLAGRYRNCSV